MRPGVELARGRDRRRARARGVTGDVLRGGNGDRRTDR
jgi:hypothetical protein